MTKTTKTMSKQQAERFEKWYHFIRDKVSNKNFNMNDFCSGNPKNLLKRNKCGTTGCLAGYLPAIFEEWCYPSKDSDKPCLITSLKKEIEETNETIGLKPIITQCVHIDDIIGLKDLLNDLKDFFGIQCKDIENLIIPDELNTWKSDNLTKNKMLNRMKQLADKYGWEIS